MTYPQPLLDALAGAVAAAGAVHGEDAAQSAAVQLLSSGLPPKPEHVAARVWRAAAWRRVDGLRRVRPAGLPADDLLAGAGDPAALVAEAEAASRLAERTAESLRRFCRRGPGRRRGPGAPIRRAVAAWLRAWRRGQVADLAGLLAESYGGQCGAAKAALCRIRKHLRAELGMS